MPRPSEDLQASILRHAAGTHQQLVVGPVRLSLFDKFKDFLADLGGAIATAALVGTYIGFSATGWSEPMSD